MSPDRADLRRLAEAARDGDCSWADLVSELSPDRVLALLDHIDALEAAEARMEGLEGAVPDQAAIRIGLHLDLLTGWVITTMDEGLVALAPTKRDCLAWVASNVGPIGQCRRLGPGDYEVSTISEDGDRGSTTYFVMSAAVYRLADPGAVAGEQPDPQVQDCKGDIRCGASTADVTPKPAARPPAEETVTDLMAALERSVAEAKEARARHRAAAAGEQP